MAKRQRKVQSHLNQKPKERKTYGPAINTTSVEAYKPGFPMNLMQGGKVFYIVLAVAIIGAVLFSVVAASNPATDQSVPDLPTETATPEGTPTATPTVDPNVSPTPVRSFSAAEDVIDETKSYTATIKTAKGDIVMELFADEAPRTVNSFVFLAQQGYFNGLTFHRVEPNFVIQGGDPRGNGTGGPGYETEEDVNDLKNTRGMVSMAKAGAVTVFGSQFFVNLKDNPALDVDTASSKRFYPWAKVTDESMAVVDQIAAGDVMESVTIEETD